MSEIIPNKEIHDQRNNIESPIKSICMKYTIQWLCKLKTEIFKTNEEKTFEQIQELLEAQKYLVEKVTSHDENEIFLILKSQNNLFHLVKVPKSFGEKQKLHLEIEGKNISLEAVPKTNGYNTEYLIDNGECDWKQIAILFTLINPEWTKQKKILDTLQAEQIKILDEIKKIKSSEIVPKQKRNKKIKPHPLTKKDIKTNRKKLIGLYGEQKILGQKIKYENELLKNIKKLIDFPYTPYNRVYDTEETRSHGYAYIDYGTQKSFKTLGEEKSILGPKEKKLEIQEAFSHNIASVLNIVERMDFYSYFQRDGITLKPQDEVHEIMNKQIGKALTTIALNQKGAFNWQRSKVGALGIGQFMPKTYENIQQRYQHLFPENLNFENGAKDHNTSFRMQALHFHEESRAMPKWIKENWLEILQDEKAKIGLYALIAAGYNGSITRIIKEAELGENFNISLLHTDALIERLSKNKETKTYVMKFVYTWEYLKRNYRNFGK